MRKTPLMKAAITLLFTMLAMTADAQYTISLYDGEIPGAKPVVDSEKTEKDGSGITRVSRISQPTITAFLPAKKNSTGTAIIIFPGGGYRINAIQHEGTDVAEYLASKGISAFVVKYRLPDSSWMTDPSRGPLQDALQALRKLRQNAAQYGINPKKIGVMGFSAGGHLAAMASNHYRSEPDGRNLRPNFSILIYPVISFSDSIGHMGSREALLGKNPTPEKVLEYSNEKQVDAHTPPAFLVHAKDDFVKYSNSTVYVQALRKNRVPAKLLTYEAGGHGYGMYNRKSDVFWPEKMMDWMKQQGFLK